MAMLQRLRALLRGRRDAALRLDDARLPELSEYARFVPGAYYGDPTWWWVPGRLCMRWMLEAAGFDVIEEFGVSPTARPASSTSSTATLRRLRAETCRSTLIRSYPMSPCAASSSSTASARASGARTSRCTRSRSARCTRSARAARDQFDALQRRLVRGRAGRVLRDRRPQRLGQEHAAQVPGRHLRARRRRDLRQRADVDVHRARRRVQPRPRRARQRDPQRHHARPLAARGARARTTQRHRVRRARGVRRTSSSRTTRPGMHVRLAFSVMIQVDADILLIDEVLAVGDAAFQQKCFDVFNRMRDAGQDDPVRHARHGAVSRFCHRAMLLERGEIVAIGEPNDVGRHATSSSTSPSEGASGDARPTPAEQRPGDGDAAHRSRRGSRTSRATGSTPACRDGAYTFQCARRVRAATWRIRRSRSSSSTRTGTTCSSRPRPSITERPGVLRGGRGGDVLPCRFDVPARARPLSAVAIVAHRGSGAGRHRPLGRACSLRRRRAARDRRARRRAVRGLDRPRHADRAEVA